MDPVRPDRALTRRSAQAAEYSRQEKVCAVTNIACRHGSTSFAENLPRCVCAGYLVEQVVPAADRLSRLSALPQGFHWVGHVPIANNWGLLQEYIHRS